MKFLFAVVCLLLVASFVAADHATSPKAPSSELFEGFIPYGTFGPPIASKSSTGEDSVKYGTFRAATLQVESAYEAPISQLSAQTVRFEGFSFSNGASEVSASVAMLAVAALALF